MPKKTKAVKTAPEKAGKKSKPKQASVKGPKRVSSSRTGTARESSKNFRLIEMLHRNEGATLKQLMDVTGWQKHSVRGFISGTAKKKLGLTVISSTAKDGVRTYRIKAA